MDQHAGDDLEIEVVADFDIELIDDVADDLDMAIDIGVDPDELDTAIVTRLSRGEIDEPPFPHVVLQLQKLNAADAGLTTFVDVIARDPALAARCLRVANAASYGRTERVTTLMQAVSTLGTGTLMRIALADGLAAAACRDGPLVVLRDAAWRQAVTSALLSSALAPMRGLAADEVFVCALLHDFGRLIAVRVIEDIVAEKHLPFLDAVSIGAWTEVVDRYRCELGILAGERWQLPSSIKSVLGLRHDQLRGHPRESLLQLVHGVDRVIALLDSNASVYLEDVITASGLSPKEAAVLFRALPGLPALVASFTIERLGQPKTAAVAQVPVPEPMPVGPRMRATTIGLAKERGFDVQLMTTSGVILSGPVGLGAQQIFNLRFNVVGSRDTFDVWLRVIATRSVGGTSEVQAVPFVLTGEPLQRWLGLARAFTV